MQHLWRHSARAALMVAASLTAASAQGQQLSSAGDDTLYLTPSIPEQRRFGLAHDLASAAHICTDASRSVQVLLVPGLPPQTLQIAAELRDESLRYCNLTISVRGPGGKILFQDTENFMGIQGISEDVTIAVHRFGNRQLLIIDNNGVSNSPLSTLYVPLITENGSYNENVLTFTSGERITFALTGGKFTISSKYFDGTTGDGQPSCCFKEASFDLNFEQGRAKFVAQGDKNGLDLYRQLAANGARRPGSLSPLPSDQTGDIRNVDITPVIEPNNLGLEVSNWQTYWIFGLPNDAGTASFCVPAVSFKVTNRSDQDLDAIQISASFLDEVKKETFGSAVQTWSMTSGEPPLPPGFSRTVSLHSSRGIKVVPYSCTAASRPTITARVQARSLGTAGQAMLGTSQVASEMRNYQAGQ